MTVPEKTSDAASADSLGPPAPALPRSSWRPFVARLHFYAGVLVGPFLIIAAVTGGLYAMAPSLERLVYRDVLHVDPGGEALPLSAQAQAAVAAYPDLTMTGLRPPAGESDSTRFYFADPSLEEEFSRAVFVDPYSGGVLGDEVTWLGYLPLSTWLDGLHRHLNLGEPGRIYSEVAASWLGVVAVGGLYLWLVKARSDQARGRRARLLTVDRGTTGRSRTVNWHGATGVWLLAALLFLSATGITWSTYAGAHVTDLRAALNWQRPQLDTAISESAPADDASAHAGHDTAESTPVVNAGQVDFDAVVQSASRVGVVVPVEITLPADSAGISVAEIDKPYRLTTNAAAVDPHTYAVTSEIDYHRDYSLVAKLADWGIRAHMGFLFGLLNQLVLLGVAIGLLTVIFRGYRMWWQRRPTRGSAWAVGRPPMRGGLLRLHPAAIAAIALTAIAIGWFLPLLGITLAVFFVVDLAIGASKHYRKRGVSLSSR